MMVHHEHEVVTEVEEVTEEVGVVTIHLDLLLMDHLDIDHQHIEVVEVVLLEIAFLPEE